MTISTLVLTTWNCILWKPLFSESLIEKIASPLGLHQSVDTQEQWWAFHACVHSQLVSRAKQLSAFLWLDSPLESDLSRGSRDNGEGEVAPQKVPLLSMRYLKQPKSANFRNGARHLSTSQSASLSASHTSTALTLTRIFRYTHYSKSVKQTSVCGS